MRKSRHIDRYLPRHALGAAVATVAIAMVGAFAPPAVAADTSAGAAAAQNARDRADCNVGKTAEDRATCLKEAGAAEADRKRHQLTNDGSTRQNAADRCNLLPGKDKTDCLARVQGASAPNEHVTTSGSVAGGGVLKETTTIVKGPAIVVPAPMVPASANH